MIIEDIKLQLTLTLYKGKQRLRRWWPQVLENMTEIQAAHNALADKVTEENADLAAAIKDEADIREQADNELRGSVVEVAASLTTETAAREAADADLQDKIVAEAEERENLSRDVEKLGYTKLDCFNYGNYYVGRTMNGSHVSNNDNLPDFIEADVGQILSFTIRLGNCDSVELPTNGIYLDGSPATLTCEYPFKEGHNYLAIFAGQATARVICDNGAFVDITSEATERENADTDLQAQIDALKESGTGGGISGTLATPEMIHEMMKNATPDVYVPDSIMIGLATDEQIKEICN